MPHTKSRYMMDLGFNDARLLCAANDFLTVTSGGTISFSRINPADYSIHFAVSTTGTIAINVTNQILRRLGFFEDLQEQFGGAGIAGSAEYQGRPDTLASMATGQPITPRTAFKIKGFKLNSYDVIYTVGTANITTLTTRVDQIQYVNGAAVPAATSVLASGANGLAVAFGANTYITNVAVPTPAYSNLADQVLWVEFSAATPGTGTFDLRGIDLYFEYNFN
jgi:hypothetical protein